MYVVTFRNSNDDLVSMFTQKFKTEDEAKMAIKIDATMFLKAHHSSNNVKFRQKSRWVNPKSEDYYFAQGQDGISCIYQYFKA